MSVRDHAVIGIGGRDHRRRIAARLETVIRGMLPDRLEFLGITRVAVPRPCMADGELWEADHVHDPTAGSAEQLGR